MLKRNGRIVGLSYVHDYIHRPKELNDMSLYDWISTCKREKLSTKKKTETAKTGSLDDEVVEDNDREEDVAQDEPIDATDDSYRDDGHSFADHDEDKPTTTAKGMLRFTADYPLFVTHGVKRLPSPLVPNFAGQTRPRRDQGDREFYCTTMLTLFKFWRTGTNFKTKETSWDEAFTAHIFSKRQEEIMKNFNIRYECLDQRDDFFSELKKGGVAGPGDLIAGRDDPDMDQSAVLDETFKLVDDGALDSDVIEIDDQQSQRYYKQHLKNISITKNIMTRVGWTTCEPNGFQDSGALTTHEPVSGIRVGSEWKEIVISKRQDILESRMQSFQVSGSGAISLGSKPIFQDIY